MRVIAGTRGGRRLTAPPGDGTRPVSDRVKESLFSSLGATVDGATVLDLFAGSGSFGIEALSRGASTAVFVERERAALRALNGNLQVLGFDAEVVGRSVEGFLQANRRQFDLVFCDPPWPFDSLRVEGILDQLSPAVVDGGVVVITRRASDEIPMPGGYRIDDERRIGDTRIIRYTKGAQP